MDHCLMVKNRDTAPFSSQVCVRTPILFVLTPEGLYHRLSVKCLLKFSDTTLDVPPFEIKNRFVENDEQTVRTLGHWWLYP